VHPVCYGPAVEWKVCRAGAVVCPARARRLSESGGLTTGTPGPRPRFDFAPAPLGHRLTPGLRRRLASCAAVGPSLARHCPPGPDVSGSRHNVGVGPGASRRAANRRRRARGVGSVSPSPGPSRVSPGGKRGGGVSLTRQIGHYARRGLPTGHVPGLRLPLPERADSSESDSTAALVRGLGTIPSNPGAPSWSKTQAGVGVRESARGPRAGGHRVRCGIPEPYTLRLSRRIPAQPGYSREGEGGPYPEDFSRVPRGRLSAPRHPGCLKQREALGAVWLTMTTGSGRWA